MVGYKLTLGLSFFDLYLALGMINEIKFRHVSE